MKRKCMYDKMCVSARAYFGACMSERKREREIKGVRMETRDTVKQLGIKKKIGKPILDNSETALMRFTMKKVVSL